MDGVRPLASIWDRALGVLLGVAASLCLVSMLATPWLHPTHDTDFWWLLWAGEQLLSGQVPRSNTLSWTAPDYPWTSHELLVAIINALAGLKHIETVRNLLNTILLLLIGWMAWRPGSAWATLAGAVWVLALVTYFGPERALSWGYLFQLTEVLLLTRFSGAWRFPVIAGLLAIWANTHGSFVVGAAILLIFDARWGLLGLVLTLMNPYGLELWSLVLGYGAGVEAKGIGQANVREWFPPDLSDSAMAFRSLCFWAPAPCWPGNAGGEWG